MKKYNEELKDLLAKHKAWLNNEEGGERANLSEADLSGANLRFNVFFCGSYGVPVYQACRGFGSRNATLTLLAIGEPSEWVFFTGCFRGTRTELESAVEKKHGQINERANYLRAIEYLWETALSNR